MSGRVPVPAGATDEVVAALHRAGLGEATAESGRRAQYATDASLYRVVPRAVAFPRHVDELAAALGVCREVGVPLTIRGAGTSIAGNAVGPGVVVDTSRYLNRVLEIHPETRTARVEPGVVLADLQRAAAPHGLRFGPDPSTHTRATLGGMLGNNACGSRALGFGRTSDNVRHLDVIAGTGEWIGPRQGEALAALVAGRLAAVRTELGRFGRQVSGYALEHLLPERIGAAGDPALALARFLVGSEGTLGVVTGATLRLVRAPEHTLLVVLGYPDMASAADAVPAVLPFTPVAVEGLDVRIVDAVRQAAAARGGAAVPELPAGAGWLMVELASGDPLDGAGPGEGGPLGPAELADRAQRVVAASGTSAWRIVTDRAEVAALWRIREDGAGLSARSPRGRPAHAGWEDSAVPPERLGGYLRHLEQLMAAHDLTGMPYGHFGEGCLHLRLDLPLDRGGPAAARKALREFLFDAGDLVARHGGSMSGEHGDGRARSELLPLMYSPEVIALFAEVKRLLDPAGLLNPGVIVGAAAVDADVRLTEPMVGASPRSAIARAVHQCTGVGKCRMSGADATASGGVMCPSYQATRDEKDSTRGRARVLQEMVNGTLVRGGWRSPEVLDALDLCLSCKGCASDCPTGIDMAAYKSEVLHQAYRGRLRPMDHYALGWLPLWARLASSSPGVARGVNRLLSLGPVASAVKRAGRIDARRELPAFASQTFRAWFADRTGAVGAEGVSGEVLLWVDSFTNSFSPEVGVAAVRVLEAAGYRVRITEQDQCCGLTWISTGQRSVARRLLRRSIEAVEPFVDQGVPVVGLEPSCTAVFRDDARDLVGRTVPVQTLAELLAGRRVADLTGVEALAQPHCHQHAVLGFEADLALLRDGGAQVSSLGGCCGLAGNFGVVEGHYDVSVAVAQVALLPGIERHTADHPDGVLLADGFSCRTQVAQLSGRRAVHLAELLAERLDPRD